MTKRIEYLGYYIEYNFYGNGEYTVQYMGDDVVFKTVEKAKRFIENILYDLGKDLK